MAEETLAAFLERRERELANKIAALQGSLRAMEAELHQVRSTRAAYSDFPPQTFGVVIGDKRLEADQDVQKDALNTFSKLIGQPTVKRLIRQVLASRAPNGATAAQIGDFIRDAYGRDVQPDTLRSQLARSKAQGMIEQRDGEWYLTKAGLMFDHPTSWPD
ncbi:MAG: hypothetical protein JO223_09720 [Hyphomicrobiales bacterium]|nr:hypothetical protein [Hyphomicrobiales bacterium]MBV8443007.1 hypothetical protein [Hyphomicrobiales bacterium]